MSFSEFDQFRRQMNQLLFDMDRTMASTWGPLWEEPMWGATQPMLMPGQGQGQGQQQQQLPGRGDKEDVKSQGGERQAQPAAAAASTAVQPHAQGAQQQQVVHRPHGGGVLAPHLRPLRTHVDVIESKDKYEVHAELPGMKKSDIQVHVDPQSNTLTLSGESKHSIDERSKDKKYIRMERSFGSFSRTMQLPADVDQGKINAKYDNGILVVELPRLPVQPQQQAKRALQIQ